MPSGALQGNYTNQSADSFHVITYIITNFQVNPSVQKNWRYINLMSGARHFCMLKSDDICVMKNIFLITTYLLTLTSLAQSDPSKYGVAGQGDELPMGLKVGQQAPDFTLNSSRGIAVNIQKELEKGPVVLIFYRGIWCPVCSRYLSNIQDSLRYILDAGASLLAVTGEVQEYTAKMSEDVGAEFPILSDKDEAVMKDYDVLFDVTDWYVTKVKVGQLSSIQKNTGQEDDRLPVPATYVIDKQGVIRYVQFDYNYKNRASVKDIIRAIKGLI